MGYIVVIAVAAIVLPLLLFVVFRGGNTRAQSRATGNTVRSEPSADEPSPTTGAVNRIESDARKKIPPA